MRYFVYALKSQVDGRIYVGLSTNVGKRLKEHSTGRTKSTKGFRPWVVIFTEECEDRLSARAKEKFYKTGIGKENLKNRVP